jgi:hypothetical protein
MSLRNQLECIHQPIFRAVELESGCWKVEKSDGHCEKCGGKWKTVLYTYFMLPYEIQRQLAERVAELMNQEREDHTP